MTDYGSMHVYGSKTKQATKARYYRLHADSIGLFITSPTAARLEIAVDMLDYQRRLGCMDVEMQRIFVDSLNTYYANPTGENVVAIIVMLNKQRELSGE